MLLSTTELNDGVAVLKLRGKLTQASMVHLLAKHCEGVELAGKAGVLIDFESVPLVNMAGLAALIDLPARMNRLLIGYCALPKRTVKRVQNLGLDRGLRIYPSVGKAASSQEFKSLSMAQTRVVLFNAPPQKNSIHQTLSDPRLELLGVPVADRMFQNFRRFGIKECLNVTSNFRGLQRTSAGQSLFHSNHRNDLARVIADARSNLRGDSVFWNIHTASDLDIAQVLADHKTNGMDVTAVRFPLKLDLGVEQVYAHFFPPRLGYSALILSKNAIEFFASLEESISFESALSRLESEGGAVHHVEATSPVYCVSDITNHSACVSAGLRGKLKWASPAGLKIAPNIWIGKTTNLHRTADLVGPCFLSENVQIGRQSKLIGPTTVCSGAQVHEGAVIENSILLPNVTVHKNEWLQSVTVSAAGAVQSGGTDDEVSQPSKRAS